MTNSSPDICPIFTTIINLFFLQNENKLSSWTKYCLIKRKVPAFSNVFHDQCATWTRFGTYSPVFIKYFNHCWIYTKNIFKSFHLKLREKRKIKKCHNSSGFFLPYGPHDVFLKINLGFFKVWFIECPQSVVCTNKTKRNVSTFTKILFTMTTSAGHKYVCKKWLINWLTRHLVCSSRI